MAVKPEIFGILSPITVEIPYESQEAADEGEKLNRELAGLARVFNGATDWGFQAFSQISSAGVQTHENQDIGKAEPRILLKKGDLVKIFRTVSDADILWDGVVDLDRSAFFRGVQKAMPHRQWAHMFFEELPAKLIRNGVVRFGALHPFCETGTEGIVWSLSEYGKPGYAGLNMLEDGDRLTVYSAVRDGALDWQGKLDFLPEQPTLIDYTTILREPTHMDTRRWMNMIWERRPVVVTPA